MKKSFYIFGGLLAASLFTACSDEKAVSVAETPAEPVAVAETPVLVETPVVAPEVVKPAEAAKAAGVLESAITDLAAAIDLAKKENRSVLVEFTGSDWCPPCKLLRKEILSKPEFDAYVKGKNAIFVELDFPRAPGKVPADIMREREKILNLYGVQGFPTVLLLDKNGAVYTKVIGPRRTIPEYLETLDSGYAVLQQFEAAVDAAQKKAEPAERATALAEALSKLPPEFQAHQKSVIEFIIANDKEDRFGFAARQREARLEVEQREMLKRFTAKHRGKNDPDAARIEALELLKNKDLLPRAKCELNKYISDGYAMQGKLKEALAYLKAARDCVPGTRRATELDRWVNQIEMIIEQKANKVDSNLPQEAPKPAPQEAPKTAPAEVEKEATPNN